MASLTIKNIKKRFGSTEVIHGVSADVQDGEFVVIVGPSGCGKSTLLRMVAGLETITEGDILINDEVVNDKEPMDRDIAMVFQNYALYPHMSVRKNMAYGLKIANTPRKEIETKVQHAAELLQLEPYLDRKPRELSGGQRQRVAMGRAIVREPALFLFDEPLSNLDAKLRVQMRLEIKKLQARLGVTSLYVTHDQVEAMTMADRMIVMHNGVAEQIGTPLEVYERPQSLFAAQFIGSPEMNVFEGEATGNKLVLDTGLEIDGGINIQGPVMIGIRPEHLIADSNGAIELRNGSTEPLGATTLLHGQLGDSETLITVSLPGVHEDRSSDSVDTFSVAPQQIHLFSKETGQRIGN